MSRREHRLPNADVHRLRSLLSGHSYFSYVFQGGGY
jgi:hypothetical protein